MAGMTMLNTAALASPVYCDGVPAALRRKGERYRLDGGTPQVLSAIEMETYLERIGGPERGKVLVGKYICARNRYFRREASREEILEDVDEDVVKALFLLSTDAIDREDRKWEQRAGRRSAADEKGAPAPGAQKPDDLCDISRDGRFIPPQTPEDLDRFREAVRAFAAEARLDGFDTEAFIAQCEERGWLTTRGARMVCWKQTARKFYLHRNKTQMTQENIQNAVGAEETAENTLSEAAADVPEQTPDAQDDFAAYCTAPEEKTSFPPYVPQETIREVPGAVASGKPETGAAPDDSRFLLDASDGAVIDSSIPVISHYLDNVSPSLPLTSYRKILLLMQKYNFEDRAVTAVMDHALQNADVSVPGYICGTLNNLGKEGRVTAESVCVSGRRKSAVNYPERPSPGEEEMNERARRAIRELQKKYPLPPAGEAQG